MALSRPHEVMKEAGAVFSFVLPAKKQPAPCLKRGHPAPRRGAGIHGGFPLVLPVKTGIHGGVRRWGVLSYVEPVRSRRCAQPPLPHHGYRIGVRYDGVVRRGRNTWNPRPPRLTGERSSPRSPMRGRYPWWPPPRLTGENRYPWRGAEVGGTLLRLAGP